MAVIIRTAFNNQDWNGQCQNAGRDNRLFQCRQAVIDVGFRVTETGQCAAPCWEQNLCVDYTWPSTTGNFGERATGRVYFLYRDVDQTLVLWGRSSIQSVEGRTLNFIEFEPLSENKQVRGLTYKYLKEIGVPEWRAGTFRYITETTSNFLDALIESIQTGNPSFKFPDQEHRDKVEKASIEKAKNFLQSRKYNVTDRQKDNCGYDLLAKRNYPPNELHVEVKGTSNEAMRFFMSRNEKQYMSNPKWRLLIVTDALNDPQASLMTEKQVIKEFELNPFAWEAIHK